MTILSLVLTAVVSLLVAVLVTDIWLLTQPFRLVSGVATGLVASVLGATVANRWFVDRQGLVVGVFRASTSAGQLVFFPLLTTLAVAVGWRAGAIVLVAIMLVLLVPVLVLFRNDPADVVAASWRGSATPVSAHRRPTPPSARRPSRSARLLVPRLDVLHLRATSNRLIGQRFAHAHAVDHGFTQTAAAGALAVMGAFNFIGTIRNSGWLTDRVDPRAFLVYYRFRGVGVTVLPFVRLDGDRRVQRPVRAGLHRDGPPTVALCADAFGRRNVGIVYGWVFAPAHVQRRARCLGGRRGRGERRRLRGVRRGGLDRDRREVRGTGHPADHATAAPRPPA